MVAKTFLGIGIKTWIVLILAGLIAWYVAYGSGEQDFVELLKAWSRQFDHLLSDLL